MYWRELHTESVCIKTDKGWRVLLKIGRQKFEAQGQPDDKLCTVVGMVEEKWQKSIQAAEHRLKNKSLTFRDQIKKMFEYSWKEADDTPLTKPVKPDMVEP